MRTRDRIDRALWRWSWQRRAQAATEKLPSSAGELERIEVGLSLLWPLALRVFCMHRFDDMPYGAIAKELGIDQQTVQFCIFDAMTAISITRRGDYARPVLRLKNLKDLFPKIE
jgi:DNA-directed RNA polymerase specialized sigma24 family protein